MSILDKITGRAKQATGDLLGDKDLSRQGTKEERKGEAKERFARTEERAEQQAREVADLERRT